MKKLMTMIAAVATAFGLFAAEYDGHAISFEDSAEGVDGTKWTPAPPWSTAITDALDLGIYSETDPVYAYDTTKVSSNTRREDDFVSKNNQMYLKLDTGSETVSRTVADADVFLDQVIKFTGFEDMQTNFTAGTKIALWTSAIEDDEDTTGEGENEADTNLYVAVGTSAGMKNVKIEVGNDFDFNAWHRVTIKKIDGSVNAKSDVTGFLVWIDGEIATIPEADADYYVDKANLVASAEYFYNKGQLFISMTSGLTVTSLGFQGVGSLDDVITSATGPEFTNLTVPVTIASLTDMSIESVKDAAGKTISPDAQGKYNVAPGTTITITFAPGTGKMLTKDTITKKIDKATTIIPADEDVEAKDIIATVTVDTADPMPYYDFTMALTDVIAAELLGAESIEIAAVKDVVGTFEGQSIKLTAGTIVAITPGGEDADWTIIGKAELEADILADKRVIVVDNEGALDGSLVYAGEVAGTLQAVILTVAQDGKISLAVDGTIITTTPGLEDTIGAPSGYQVVASEPEDDYITYTVEEIKVDYVAEINGKQYETLAKAFEEAVDNDEIELLKDVALDDWITTAKKVTLDLAGFTVSPSASFVGYPNDTLFGVKRGGVLTVNDSSVNGTGTITTGDNTTMWGCAKVTILGEAATGDPATIIVNGGNFVGRRGAICAHGVRRGGYITINGGTFSCLSEGSNVDAAIYFPAEGALTITGGSFTGKTGVYAKSGTVNITGGTFASTAASWVDYAPYNNGVNGAGAALVLEKLLPDEGGYADNLVCTVTGGKFDAPIYSFARQGSETLVGFIGSDVLVKDTITTPVEYIANMPEAGYQNAWVDSTTNPGYKTPGAEAIEYTITYNDFDDWAQDFEPVEKYTIETPTFDLPVAENIAARMGATFKGWTNEVGDTVTEVKVGTTGNLAFYAVWEQAGTDEVAEEIKDKVADVPEGKETDVRNNMIAINEACGSVAEGTAWITKIYGDAKIPGEKLAATDAELIAMSVAYDLPIVTEEPKATVVAAESESGSPAFQFTITADNDVSIDLAKAKAQKIVKYSSDLATDEFDASTADEVKITVDKAKSNVMKAEFVAGPTKGFMKADFTVAK